MSNQLPYPLTPGPNIPGPYQTEDSSRMNNNPYPSGVPTSLPYPTQAPVYPSAPPNLPNQQPFYPQANQPPYPVQGQPVHSQIPYPPVPGHPGQVPQAPYPAVPNYPGQTPYPPVPNHPGHHSAPYADQGAYSSEEPLSKQGQIELNEGRSGLTSKLIDRGLQIAKGAIDKTPIGKYVPTNMDFMNKPNPGSKPTQEDATDGNTSSSAGGKFFGHKHHFQSGQGELKKWSGQDYKKNQKGMQIKGNIV